MNDTRFKNIASRLRELGFEATDQYTGGGITCVFVRESDTTEWCFGEANEMWGGQLVTHADGEPIEHDGLCEYIETAVPSTSDDVVAIAQALAVELSKHQAKAALEDVNAAGA